MKRVCSTQSNTTRRWESCTHCPVPGTLSLNASNSRVKPSDPDEEDYDQQTAYVGYDLRGARTTLTLNVGASRIKESGSTDLVRR